MTAVSPALARTWSGSVSHKRAEAYEKYLHRTGIVDLRVTPGNLGVILLRRDVGTETEFTVLSLWTNEEAIRRFAGEDFHKAVYYPEDQDFLLRMDPHVIHYQVRSSHLVAQP